MPCIQQRNDPVKQIKSENTLHVRRERSSGLVDQNFSGRVILSLIFLLATREASGKLQTNSRHIAIPQILELISRYISTALANEPRILVTFAPNHHLTGTSSRNGITEARLEIAGCAETEAF